MRERSLASAKLALSGATQSPPARASDPDLSILKTLDSAEFYSSGPFFSILLERPCVMRNRNWRSGPTPRLPHAAARCLGHCGVVVNLML